MSLELAAFALGIAVVVRIGRLAVVPLVPEEQKNHGGGDQEENHGFFHRGHANTEAQP